MCVGAKVTTFLFSRKYLTGNHEMCMMWIWNVVSLYEISGTGKSSRAGALLSGLFQIRQKVFVCSSFFQEF